jgi:hypothetical protein
VYQIPNKAGKFPQNPPEITGRFLLLFDPAGNISKKVA